MYKKLCAQKITCAGAIVKIQGPHMAFAVSKFITVPQLPKMFFA